MSEFENVVFVPAEPPESHPLIQYQGFHPNRITKIPRGHVKVSGYQAFAVDVTFEEDIAVPLRDGVKIYTDVYRPREMKKVPAILAWSPYGKRGTDHTFQTYDNMGPARMCIPFHNLSGYEKFEGPNPAEWTRRGYALVDPDARGAFNSEGDTYWWNGQEARDIHDTIDWISKQDWCNGSVVMQGNSWLGISQINVASRYPHPALKAIAPWEGLTDMYRHVACRGGLPSTTGFLEALMSGFTGRGKIEDPFATLRKHPFYDEYWKDKTMPVENIDIPMYLTASYSTGLHSAGSFHTFEAAKTKQKWLRVHDTQEWYDIYRQENIDDLARFYDRYAKGVENGWEKTPHLRLSLIGFHEGMARTITERPEPEDDSFPLKRTQMRKFYLDAATKSGSLSVPTVASEISHEAHLSAERSSFDVTFFKYTELSGWPWVRLFMSCDAHTDMDVVVILRKVGIFGNELEHANYPVTISISELANVNVAKFLGPSGYLRASHAVTLEDRKDPEMGYPEYKHDRSEPVAPPGKVVALDIPIWPIGMVFEAGESLRLNVAGTDMALPELEVSKAREDENKGRHTIYTGGDTKSFLLLPVIAG